MGRTRTQLGMCVAEYATGTCAAVGIACGLWLLHPWFARLLMTILTSIQHLWIW